MIARKKDIARIIPGFQWFRSIWFRDDGAVTVFAVIVLSSLLLFFSLLIDYARIAAMHKLTEDAVRSSIRSVLSAYDRNLYERYGLFGRGGTDGQTIFSEAMRGNVETDRAVGTDFMRLVQLKADASTLQSAAFLGNHDVFARQILEEMKYKAPIDFTLELAGKFAPMAGAMKQASVTINLLESMRKLYEKREAHLARVLEFQQTSAAKANGSRMGPLIPYGFSTGPIERSTANSIASEFEVYAKQVEYDQSLSSTQTPKYTKEINEYKDKARLVGAQLAEISTDLSVEHRRLLSEGLNELEAARALNDQMQQLINQEGQSNANAGYDKVANSDTKDWEQHDVPPSAASDIEQISGAIDELILPDGWFSTYVQELEEQITGFAAVEREAASFQAKSLSLLEAPINGAFPKDLLEAVKTLELAYINYHNQYIQPATIILNRKDELESSDVKKQLKQQEAKTGSLWKQARSMLSGFSSMPHREEHTQVFDKVKERFKANLLFNQQSNEAKHEVESQKANNAHEEAEQSSALMGGLFSGMADMLERTRDSLYYGEYVVHHYTTFAPQHLRSLMTGGVLDSLSEVMSFHNQESEYVIYGFHNSFGNIAAAYGELFAVRLAVRMMEGLIESKSLGHPLLILSAALIYGLEKTIEDMLSFSEKGSAPLSKYVRVELSYTDYLRLFMLIHSADEEGRLARMIAVIEENSGTTLSAVPSAVTGETHVSAKLWFVPGLMQVLGRFGLLEGKVVGNRYETTQTIGWSY